MSVKSVISTVIAGALASGLVFGGGHNNKITSSVPNPNPRVGHPANIIVPGFSLQKIAHGSDALENPSGIITKFGFLNDFPPRPIEATRTEPDENTYLVFDKNPGGPTPGFDYGRRFLYQGHENAADFAYITRINLDVADPAHRITLLTPSRPMLISAAYRQINLAGPSGAFINLIDLRECAERTKA